MTTMTIITLITHSNNTDKNDNRTLTIMTMIKARLPNKITMVSANNQSTRPDQSKESAQGEQ